MPKTKKPYLKITIKAFTILTLSFLVTQFFKNLPKENEEGKVLPSIAFRQVIREVNPNDTDWDGMPNIWEDQYGLNPNDENDAVLDGDNDGLTNLNEYLYNTDPTDSDTDNGTLMDGAEIAQGKDPLDPTDDIPPVVEPEDNGGSGDGDNDDNNSNNNKKNKEQKQITIEDLDNDNLTNEEETNIYYTNPTLKDSDYDGLSDYDEVINYFTNPNKYDTDGGSIGDGDEITNRTNPKDPTDDFKYYLNIYILNDKENTLQNKDTNKQVCISNEPFTVAFNTKTIITDIKITINKKETTFDITKPSIEITCPEIGINTLDISFIIKNKTYHITRKIESLPKGTVEVHYKGKFETYYKYIPKYKPTALKNTKLKIEQIIDNNTQPYISDIYNISGTITTNENGEYYLAVTPGKYKYSTGNTYEPGYFEVTAATPSIYNRTLILEKNGDNLFWYLIGITTLGIVTLFINIIKDIISIRKKRKH